MVVKKIKGVDVSKLTTRQQTSLSKHSEHHSKEHMKYMVNAMKNGTTFLKSHTEAMKKVGK